MQIIFNYLGSWIKHTGTNGREAFLRNSQSGAPAYAGTQTHTC